jgi:hypothetical protein
MVYILGHIVYEETNTKNIKDNFMGAYYIPTHGIQHKKKKKKKNLHCRPQNKVHFIHFIYSEDSGFDVRGHMAP